MTEIRLKNKTILLIVIAVVAGVFAATIATVAALSLSVTSVPQKIVTYGVSSLHTQTTITNPVNNYIVFVNSTQGPVFLDELQVNHQVPPASVSNITINGAVQWPLTTDQSKLVPSCSSNAGPNCYGELIGAIESSGTAGTVNNILVKDPLGNEAIQADAGSHAAQSIEIQTAYGNYGPSVLSVSALITAPSTAHVTLTLVTISRP